MGPNGMVFGELGVGGAEVAARVVGGGDLVGHRLHHGDELTSGIVGVGLRRLLQNDEVGLARADDRRDGRLA